MHVPFHKPYITANEIAAVTNALQNGWLTMGSQTIKFEEDFARYLKLQSAIAVNSCTSALHLVMEAAGITKDDEIILPAMTFVATAEVAHYLGAKVILTDVDRNTHLMTSENIEGKITGKTKAVIPVHYAGQSVDIDPIKKIISDKGISLIDDAAHAFPTRYKGQLIGTCTDATCFSFYATKTITTGEGGMITSANQQWLDRMRRTRLHGISKDAWKRYTKEGNWQYDVMEDGFKYNMTDLSAAIGIEQLKIADWMTEERKKISDKYDSAFGENESFYLYKIEDYCSSSYHLYPLRINLERLSIDRDQFIDQLRERDIMTSVHYIPLYRFTRYKNLGFRGEDFPETEWIFNRLISLPIYPGMSEEMINYVIENVIDIANRNKR